MLVKTRCSILLKELFRTRMIEKEESLQADAGNACSPFCGLVRVPIMMQNDIPLFK